MTRATITGGAFATVLVLLALAAGYRLYLPRAGSKATWSHRLLVLRYH